MSSSPSSIRIVAIGYILGMALVLPCIEFTKAYIRFIGVDAVLFIFCLVIALSLFIYFFLFRTNSTPGEVTTDEAPKNLSR